MCAKTFIRQLSDARVCSRCPYVGNVFIVRQKRAGLYFAAGHRRCLIVGNEFS